MAQQSQPQTPDAQTFVVGVDSGGTFTDAVAIHRDGRVATAKAYSTPQHPAEGVLNAVAALAAEVGLSRPELLRAVTRFVHGTTVSTNALIERRGAVVGLLTTAGFEDTLTIGRGPMRRTGGLPYQRAMDFARTDPPAPLVPRRLVAGVHERVTASGAVLYPLDEAQARVQIERLVDEGMESLAVCLLWSFRNPAHERRLRELAKEVAPLVEVSLSSEIAPLNGEFERAVTTVVNAYVGPRTTGYLDSLRRALADEGLAVDVEVMKSSGGCCHPEDVPQEAASIIHSGPIGGLIAARELGARLGIGNIITTDMGGTSFDVGLMHDGQFEIEPTTFVDQGMPVRTSAVKLTAIGAGGGSIAWTDGRRLMVGPHSAGAEPGPACYGLGGTEPTVTDALVVLGILDPEYFFGGRRTLRRDLAEAAIARAVAEPLGLDVREAAAGIYEIVNANMSDLIRKVTVESGWDPRAFSLLCYGGSGPAHCAFFGPALGIREVIIPDTSPVFSALGAARSEVRYSSVASARLAVGGDDTVAAFNEAFARLEAEAFARSGLGRDGGVEVVRKVDVRYRGQMNELTLPWPHPPLAPGEAGRIREAFNAVYVAKFGAGTTRDSAALEVVTFRVDLVRADPRLEQHRATTPASAADTTPVPAPVPAPVPKARREVYQRGTGAEDIPVYDRDALGGATLTGPCLIERADTTVFVPRGRSIAVDDLGNLRLRKEAIR